MFECNNAQRMWRLFHSLTNQRVASLLDILLCGLSIEHEIVKSVILKALIQIDRSKDCNDRVVTSQCAFYVDLEARVSNRPSKLREFANFLRSGV